MRRALVTFGNGDCGRLGHHDLLGQELPCVVRALLGTHVESVSCGGAHTAVVADGSLYTFGLNDRGQLGHSPGQPQVAVPREVLMPEAVTAAAAGSRHTLCITASGAVWSFGDSGAGQLGLGKEVGQAQEPRLVKALHGEKIVGVAAGLDHSLAVTAGGEVYSWGSVEHGKLGHGRSTSVGLAGLGSVESKPRLVRALEALRISAVAAGHMHSAALAVDGRALTWGNGRFRQLGLGPGCPDEVVKPTQVDGVHSVAHIACGGLHTLFAQHSGAVLACGANQNGVLGLGHGQEELKASRPTRLPAVDSAAAVAAGWKHSAALTSDGGLLTWGWGGSQGSAYHFEDGGAGGQLGLGSEFDYWAPAAVEAVLLPSGERLAQGRRGGAQAWRALQVACGLNHSAAVCEIEGL